MAWFKFSRYSYSIVNNADGLVFKCTIKSASDCPALFALRDILKGKIEQALEEYEQQAKLLDKEG